MITQPKVPYDKIIQCSEIDTSRMTLLMHRDSNRTTSCLRIADRFILLGYGKNFSYMNDDKNGQEAIDCMFKFIRYYTEEDQLIIDGK